MANEYSGCVIFRQCLHWADRERSRRFVVPERTTTNLTQGTSASLIMPKSCVMSTGFFRTFHVPASSAVDAVVSRIGRNHDRSQSRIPGLNFFGECGSVHAGHFEVKQTQIEPAFGLRNRALEFSQSDISVAGCLRLISDFGQNIR